MRYIIILLGFNFLVFAKIYSQDESAFSNGTFKTKIPGQAAEYTLYTIIDTSQLSRFNHVFDFESFNMSSLEKFKKFIKPYADKGDPLGEFLYAKTFDLYPYGLGDATNADTAMIYYNKAADQKLVTAEFFLYQAYKSGFMNREPDNAKALKYLQRTIDHGDSVQKANGYKELAYLYYNGATPELKADTLKTKEMLENSLKYNPTDGMAIDFLAGIYEDLGDYGKAIEWYIKSDNDLSRAKAAIWLIEGKKVKKDLKKGLKIIYQSIEAFIASGADINELGGSNPAYLLNKLYYCDKLVLKEHCGKYLMKDFICD